MRTRIFNVLLAGLAFFGLLGGPLMAQAVNQPDGVYCWCKLTSGTCENHRLNDAPEGSRLALGCTADAAHFAGTGVGNTQVCSNYCSFRGMRAVHCETDYRDYLTSDSTADESLRCAPLRPVVGSSATSGATPAGIGDGGEGRTSPSDFGFVNPLGTSDLRVVISRIIRAALGVVGAVFLAMFVYGGLLWMTSGDSKRIEQARSTLINAVIGMAIVAFSYSMVSIVFNLANQVSGGG